MVSKKVLVCLFVFLILSACVGDIEHNLSELVQNQEVLKQNRAKWESRHITHYRMSVSLPYETTDIGQLPMPLTIEVKGGAVISVVDAHGAKIPPADGGDSAYYYQNYFTVPGLFTYVNQYYSMKPPSMTVMYDPALGFPDSIYIDPYKEPCCQDFTIEVRDFQVLP